MIEPPPRDRDETREPVEVPDSATGEATPRPPRELAHGPVSERRFEAEGRQWVARLGGRGACGTGEYGLGLVEAVHFFDPSALERPLREALLARGRFAMLYDAELIGLLATATAVVAADAAPMAPRPRTRSRD